MKILPNNQITIDLLGYSENTRIPYTLNPHDIIETWKEPISFDELNPQSEYLYYVLISSSYKLLRFINSTNHQFIPTYYFIKPDNTPTTHPHFQITEEDYTQIEKHGFNLGKTQRILFIQETSYFIKPPMESERVTNPLPRIQA